MIIRAEQFLSDHRLRDRNNIFSLACVSIVERRSIQSPKTNRSVFVTVFTSHDYNYNISLYFFHFPTRSCQKPKRCYRVVTYRRKMIFSHWKTIKKTVTMRNKRREFLLATPASSHLQPTVMKLKS